MSTNVENINQDSIGSVDKVKRMLINDLIGNLEDERSIYRIVVEVDHYDYSNNSVKDEIAWSDTFKYIIYANSEEEAREIVELDLDDKFFHIDTYFNEITDLCCGPSFEIHAEFCHLEVDTIKSRLDSGVLDFRKIE